MTASGRFDHEPHRFEKWRCLPWEICTKCGLVRLRNRITDFCVRHGCNAKDHPLYARERSRRA